MKNRIKLAISTFLILILSSVSFSEHCGSHEAKSTASVEKKAMNIVETAIAAETFNTLVTAVKAADLVDALSGEGPFTVFAPTDEAFEMLSEGTIEALLKDKKQLTSILTYHVVSGKVMAGDVVKLKTAQTLNGQNVTIMVDKNSVMIDNANVIMTDIECSNGVIHVIDAVILPPAEKAEK